MRQGWEVKKLGGICEFVRGPFGGSLKKSMFKDSGYAVYEQQHAIYNQFSSIRYFVDENKFNEMNRFKLNAGDLIMSCSGTMGKTAIVPQNIKEGIINQALLKLTPSEKININFLKIWMESPDFQNKINDLSQGAAIKNVASVKILKEIDINLPQIREQKQIVEVLDKAFADIDVIKANAEQNLKNTKELFDSYLQNIFSNPSNDWELSKIKDIGLTQTGSTPKTSDPLNFGNAIPFVKPADINIDGNGCINYKNMGLSEKGKELSRIIPKNSVLMVCIGATITKIGYSLFDITCNQQINTVTPKANIDFKFIYYAMSHSSFTSQVLHGASQATLPIINKSKWETLNILYPQSLQEQQKIVEKLDNISKEVKLLEEVYKKKIEDCEELKKSLLDKAFKGELI
ncbi:MAG TPA: hypothetical protein DCL21_02905 [Alphaproteobacteria bacterium]|nr:hypothetical protein [Alphaproteobacteria bacterium]